MEKEEYYKKRKELMNALSKTREAINELEQSYIREHQSFCIDDKVTIIQYSEKGGVIFRRDVFVVDYLEYNGVVFPLFNDSKKDGSKSAKRFYLYHLNRYSRTEITNGKVTDNYDSIADFMYI